MPAAQSVHKSEKLRLYQKIDVRNNIREAKKSFQMDYNIVAINALTLHRLKSNWVKE
jgi:hypothetical protein